MRRIVALLLMLILLCGCTANPPEPACITVSLILPEGCRVLENGLQIQSGEDAVFELVVENGYQLSAVEYDGNYSVENKHGLFYVRLESVRYPARVPVKLISDFCSVTYDPNGAGGRAKSFVYNTAEHRRPNTSIGTDIFSRDGHTLTGWNTEADGSGTRIGLGSRVSVPDGKLTLYAQWEPWLPETQFSWEVTEFGARITACYSTADRLVIPGMLGGHAVTAIGGKAFFQCSASHIILPPTVRVLEPGAFTDCALRELTFFDNIENFGDGSFVVCPDFSTVHINAIEAPYGYDYRRESCFADKLDLLIEARGQRKMVFYGGCSMWYNLEGSLVQAVVGEDYRVINLGLNGVINSSAQMQILTPFLEEGDIFFHTPELSSPSQMMWRTEMINHDRKLWSGLEYNYDLVSLLDIRTLPHFFDIFHYWLSTKEHTSSYTDVYRDALGNCYVDEFGCASFLRQDTGEELDDQVYLDPTCFDPVAMARLEARYQAIQARGAKVYVGYACVNMDALPEDQRDRVGLMDTLFRQTFSEMAGVTVVGSQFDYLYRNSDFYDTNYHLLSEQARKNTQIWLEALADQLVRDGLWPENT